jgi:hypothetical protein
MQLIEGNDRQPARPAARRAPVIWPWLLMGVPGRPPGLQSSRTSRGKVALSFSLLC